MKTNVSYLFVYSYSKINFDNLPVLTFCQKGKKLFQKWDDLFLSKCKE